MTPNKKNIEFRKFLDSNPNIPTYENPPQPPPQKKLDGDIYEGAIPIGNTSLSMKSKKQPPENKIPEGEIREDVPSNENKYFNTETLHHAIIFLSIVFGLKMIEMNWSTIKVFIDVHQDYIFLFFVVLILSSNIYRIRNI